jgi:hypothetical protein
VPDRDDAGLASLLLEAPVGVALLAKLEGLYRRDGPWFDSPKGSQPDAVAQGVEAVAELPFGQLLDLVLEGAHDIAGPWTMGAPSELAEAYQWANQRATIAEVLAARFGLVLRSSLDRSRQECWIDPWPAQRSLDERQCFRDFSDVYGAGEFPWDGLWTVSDPPPEAHDALISAWEMNDGPVSRWLLPVRSDARVYEIHQPGDWAELVARYPHRADDPHAGWELPGPNQANCGVQDLLAGQYRQAIRDAIGAHFVPDWRAVAADFDGVHLSWAGFLTSEGYISDLDGGVTMLRYWSSERTLWLADAFETPHPLPAPNLSGSICGVLGTDPRIDHCRQRTDQAALAVMLGRL